MSKQGLESNEEQRERWLIEDHKRREEEKISKQALIMGLIIGIIFAIVFNVFIGLFVGFLSYFFMEDLSSIEYIYYIDEDGNEVIIDEDRNEKY